MSKVYFMCKKSFKVWYLGHSTQDLHRNRIYKIFFQIEKSCFPCPECQKNVRNTFFRLFGKFHKKNHGRVMTVSRTPPLIMAILGNSYSNTSSTLPSNFKKKVFSSDDSDFRALQNIFYGFP